MKKKPLMVGYEQDVVIGASVNLLFAWSKFAVLWVCTEYQNGNGWTKNEFFIINVVQSYEVIDIFDNTVLIDWTKISWLDNVWNGR